MWLMLSVLWALMVAELLLLLNSVLVCWVELDCEFGRLVVQRCLTVDTSVKPYQGWEPASESGWGGEATPSRARCCLHSAKMAMCVSLSCLCCAYWIMQVSMQKHMCLWPVANPQPSHSAQWLFYTVVTLTPVTTSHQHFMPALWEATVGRNKVPL